MELAHIVDRIATSLPFASLVEQVETDVVSHLYLSGLHGSALSMVLKALSDRTQRLIFCVAADEDDAGYLYNDLTLLWGAERAESEVYYYPSRYRRGIRYGQVDSAHEIVRSQTLSQLLSQRYPRIVVTTPEAMMEGIAYEESDGQQGFELRVGDTIERSQLRSQLEQMGFKEENYVYLPGTFAVRGGIVDIYSYAHDKPVRIDFFDDEVERIRSFEPDTQLSTHQLQQMTVLYSLSKQEESHLYSLLSLLPTNALLYIDSYLALPASLQQTFDTPPVHKEENIHQTIDALRASLIAPAVLMREIGQFSLLSRNISSHAGWSEISFGQKPEPLFHKHFNLLTDAILKHADVGVETCIMSDQESQIDRLVAIFKEQGRGASFHPVRPSLHAGFVDEGNSLACYTDHTIFERFHKYSLKTEQIRRLDATTALKELSKYENGDYVVHSDYGIGVFVGLLTREIDGRKSEHVRIKFRGNHNFIDLNIHSLHLLSKYKNRDTEIPPQLSELGSKSWKLLKERTKKKVKDIARDLIKVYADRLEERGFAFSPDSFMQKELEASFAYEDTPDQMLATELVKRDMERPVPMDRLICGDVGFGKTEIAVRAAFKAVCDSKQVALLVPTTLLAYQHYNTFSKRLRDFPCRIEYLSRAKSAKEKKELLADLSEGRIDIIIGTHALVRKGVTFKDLGLLIIDEEQKFGVSDKERLRQYRSTVDTLTLTATPIPRTLQFSLMGARDLSNIQTPPPNRQPVRTEHILFDPDTIREAISYELARGGQVFFVHNRVRSIDEIAHKIRRLVPNIRIGVGHGQMPPAELEQLILDFHRHEYDLLLTTAIVENGIDVPNANTIIINDAQRFGLSDLHQLRGRVGRGDRKAYCYLITPPLEYLTSEAQSRMKGITTFADLGSGIHIAMQDLDIRGAGNLLGAEQSGFVADLGYETYRRVLEEAVMELKNEEFSELFDSQRQEDHTLRYVYSTAVDTDVEAFFPSAYIPGDNERMLLYKELDRLSSEAEISPFRDRLIDRFGPLPPEAEELLAVLRLRLFAAQCGVERVHLQKRILRMFLVSDFNSSYYSSPLFTTILTNAVLYPERLSFVEKNGRRYIEVSAVDTLAEAHSLLLALTTT